MPSADVPDEPPAAPGPTVAEPRAVPPSPVGPDGAGSRLRGTLREFLIIVAGVLAALGAQAWWEGMQEREREQAYLAQLERDAAENYERLGAAITEDSLAALASDSAMLALEGKLTGVSGQQLLEWIGRVGQASDFQPVTGVHRALQETGDLRLIRNDDVRHAITAYATSLDRETARLEQLRGAVLDAVPVFARALPAMRLIFVRGPDPSEVDLEALRRDDVAVAVFTFQAATENRLAGLRRMRESTLGLLETIGGAGSGGAPPPDPAR